MKDIIIQFLMKYGKQVAKIVISAVAECAIALIEYFFDKNTKAQFA